MGGLPSITSAVGSFNDDALAPNHKQRQYYEMFGNRAIWAGGFTMFIKGAHQHVLAGRDLRRRQGCGHPGIEALRRSILLHRRPRPGSRPEFAGGGWAHTALMLAAFDGHTETVRLLLGRGAKVGDRDPARLHVTDLVDPVGWPRLRYPRRFLRNGDLMKADLMGSGR